MNNQKIKKELSQIMNAFMLIFVILLQLTCCNQEQSKSVQTKNSSQVDKNDTSLKLKFTSGVRSILEDSKGNFWFGSLQEGVCLFDGKSFKYFTVKDGMSDNQIRSIQEDDNGNIWFGTANGVSSYNGKNIINQTPKNILITNEFPPNEWAITDKDFWFNAGNVNGVYRFDGQEVKYLEFPKTKLINSYNVYHSTGFSKGKNNQIWMATYAGVFGYNGKTFTIINDESLKLNDEIGYLHIRSILEDSKGKLWIGNNGIGVLLNNGKRTINFSEENGLIHFNSSRKGAPSPAGTLEHVFTITEDKKGNIWFGDRDSGAWKFDGKTITNYTKKDGLIGGCVQAIYQDKKGKLWFGMANGNVYQFNGKSFDRKY